MRATNQTFAGRSASRRMYQGNQLRAVLMRIRRGRPWHEPGRQARCIRRHLELVGGTAARAALGDVARSRSISAGVVPMARISAASPPSAPRRGGPARSRPRPRRPCGRKGERDLRRLLVPPFTSRSAGPAVGSRASRAASRAPQVGLETAQTRVDESTGPSEELERRVQGRPSSPCRSRRTLPSCARAAPGPSGARGRGPGRGRGPSWWALTGSARRACAPCGQSRDLQVMAAHGRCLLASLRFSPSWVSTVPAPCCWSARVASSASSSASPGMKRETDRRTTRERMARSRSHTLRDPARKALRISPMADPRG